MKCTEYQPLKQTSISQKGCFTISAQETEKIRLSSPALDLMADLSKTETITIRPWATYTEANHRLLQAKLHQLIVIGPDGQIEGVLTTNDLWGDRPVRIAAEYGVQHSELLVSDIMTPVESVDVLSLADVSQAKVGHILETLKKAGRIHALVVDKDSLGRQVLCGIFSALHIARQVGVEMIHRESKRTFEEIDAVIAA